MRPERLLVMDTTLRLKEGEFSRWKRNLKAVLLSHYRHFFTFLFLS